MSFVWAAGVVVTFGLIVVGLGLPARAREVGRRSMDGIDVLRDPSLDDGTKEKALQRHAVELFKLLVILTGGSALAIAVPLGGVWLLERLGLASLHGVLVVLGRIDFLVATTVVGLLAFFLLRGSR